MMKWLRALISKDDLTSLQSHDQNISENIIYNTLITIIMMFLVRLLYDSHYAYHKRRCGVNVLVTFSKRT